MLGSSEISFRIPGLKITFEIHPLRDLLFIICCHLSDLKNFPTIKLLQNRYERMLFMIWHLKRYHRGYFPDLEKYSKLWFTRKKYDLLLKVQ